MNTSPLQTLRFPVSLILAGVYYAVFWDEGLGINLPMFSFLLMGVNLIQSPEARSSRPVWIAATGVVLTGIMVVWHNTGVAKVVHVLNLLLFVGFTHEPRLRSVAYGVGQALYNFWRLPQTLGSEMKSLAGQYSFFRSLSPWLKLAVIPLGVVALFFTLFYLANPLFSDLINKSLGGFLSLLQNLSMPEILFYLSGLVLTMGALYHARQPGLLAKEWMYPDQLERIHTRSKLKAAFSATGLRKEYFTGVMLMGMVNMLLLVNNALDIKGIWFGFHPSPELNLSQFVHEGTWYLVFSILLSMGIMLYFFRGNQNFIFQSGWLKKLSYLWILQNVVLTCSVAIRNYHYISAHGLAYKRIGVIFFLLLVVFGLATLLLKIRDRMSGSYIFRTNSWAVYGVGLLLSLVNWDVAIAQYNLGVHARTKTVDRYYLLELSDKALPVLLQYDAVFAHGAIAPDYSPEQQVLRNRISVFQQTWEQKGWLSWNVAEADAIRKLKGTQP